MNIELPDLDLAEFIAGRRRLHSLAEVRADPVAAHETIFPRRHKLATSDAHRKAISELHDSHPRRVIKAFRGFGKTTLAEEAALIKAGLGRFSYGMILGNTYGRAAQRLAAIKTEIDTNRALQDIFGDLHGPLWQEGKVRLSNDVVLQAFGAGQSLRGAKEDVRPDFILIDDLEEDDWTRTPEAIEANAIWFYSSFLPGLDDVLTTPIRWIGTPYENCLLNRVGKSEGWEESSYPIRYRDLDSGDWVATWPEKYPLEKIDTIRKIYVDQGRLREFNQEYMVEETAKEDALFKERMFRYEPAKPRVWQALFAMIDPARTNKKTSDMTGWAVWSWDLGARLTIWEAGGDFLMPDKIVDLPFDLHKRWGLTEVGFEEDGLNEWAMQPIRDMQLRRGVLPIRAMRAPHGKLDFIKGLQPYFAANTVAMVGERADFAVLTAQLLAFPRDLIDVPNALAYALLMRPGDVVHPDFSAECIGDGFDIVPDEAVYLAMNADGERVTGVLVQESRGVIRVLADFIYEGMPAEVAGNMVLSASRVAGRKVRAVVGPEHGDKYRNHGLVAALARSSVPTSYGSRAADTGRAQLRVALQKRLRGGPGLMVATEAAWVLRGLAGGFVFNLNPGNVMAPEPRKGVYRTLIEGLESFCGLAALSQEPDDDAPGAWRTTDDGRRYRSALRK